MSWMSSSPRSEGDVKEVVSECGCSSLRETDNVEPDQFPSQANPSLSTTTAPTRAVDEHGILRSSLREEEPCDDGGVGVDLDANLSRNWSFSVTAGGARNRPTGVTGDPDVDHHHASRNSNWSAGVDGYSKTNYDGDPVDPTDVLARKSISLEGLWQAEAEPPRSFSYEEALAPRRSSWSVEPARRSLERVQSSVIEGRRWKSRSTGFNFLPGRSNNETGETFAGLEISKLTVMPPLKETSEITLKPLTTLPVSIKFCNLVYRVSTEEQSSSSWVDVKSWGEKMRRSAQEKIILHGISGAVCPGQMLGILGPSGSGKTSLVQMLAGRIPNYEGTITHNDVPLSKSMKRRTGLVTQDDILYPHLTVKETLLYAALLRLPAEFSRQEKRRRALDVLLELGLDKCQDTCVGSAYVRGASGGERKRVSIGCEILTDPSLLLLDEPTSGLDSTTALNIVRILRNLAHAGKTIISTIHQPSSVIYHMFDKILLLSDGHTLFFGRGNKALGYFEYIGFHPTFATNPADFLVDLANGVTHDLEDLNRESSPFVLSKPKAEEIADERNHIKKLLKDAYLAHMMQETRFDYCDLRPNSADRLQITHDTVERRDWSTSWPEQFIILSRRAVKERIHGHFSAPRILETFVVAIIASLIWWDSSNSIEDQAGLLFFSTMVWAYFPLYCAIYTFPLERDMVRKERASGMYRLSAYFCAQSMIDLPMELILPTFYTILVYWMGGLRSTAVAFLATWAALLFNVLAAQGMGLAIGAVCMNLKKASHLASASMLVILMTGGFFSKNIFSALEWLKYISFSYHAFKLELNAQFREEDVYPCKTGQCQIADVQAISTVGLGGTLSSALAMLAFLVGFRLVAYIALRRTKV
ncbi:hypothetical protein R1flu_003469 [Riccia fluitans]|uniref:ABC transporter domain-containing protein n=1 Tax=Riccia fluitans TaxID=41844 RepID=A0ABD1Y941_9MARC